MGHLINICNIPFQYNQFFFWTPCHTRDAWPKQQIVWHFDSFHCWTPHLSFIWPVGCVLVSGKLDNRHVSPFTPHDRSALIPLKLPKNLISREVSGKQGLQLINIFMPYTLLLVLSNSWLKSIVSLTSSHLNSLVCRSFGRKKGFYSFGRIFVICNMIWERERICMVHKLRN